MTSSQKNKPTNKGSRAKEVASKTKIVQPTVEASTSSSSDSEDEQKSTTGDPSEDVEELRSSDNDGAPEKEVNKEPEDEEEEIIIQNFQEFTADQQRGEMEKLKETNPFFQEFIKEQVRIHQQKLAEPPATPKKGNAVAQTRAPRQTDNMVEQTRLTQVENLKGPSATKLDELKAFAEGWKRRHS
jgi:hypothetical protein